MNFSEVLNQYIEHDELSLTELAQAAGLSKATISRFRNGKQKPSSSESKSVLRLAKAIADVSKSEYSFDEVYDSLSGTLKNENDILPMIIEKMNLLVDVMEIRIADLSRYMKFDASYLSRIRAGKRRPADISKFCDDIACFTASKLEPCKKYSLIRLLGVEGDIVSASDCRDAVLNWLLDGKTDNHNMIRNFLLKLNDFDLNAYIRALSSQSTQDISVAVQPLNFSSKDYYSIPNFMEGVLDWAKATIISDSEKPCLIYSDMPIAEISENSIFMQRLLILLAALLKKGIRLNVIHNVERSVNEMMIGLENWIPLYMTGLVSPYYLKGYHDNYFHHILHTSGSAVL